ncbi:MAG: response regulator [Pseudonocardia sp.]|uniref:response regulator n=1 Tax=Pseudonocardia sp. TaxID=60912 RepID=UPI001ACB61DC|nr:response regulator [Pseudonocardia sp.]MBN9102321.1 response regulator [Pseudonocardia sp.]
MQDWTALAGVVIWPVVVLISVFVFRKVLRNILSRDDLSFSGPAGISFSARRAAGALVEASQSKPAAGQLSDGDAQDQVQEVAAFVRRLRRSPRLLWVDDQPSNNRYETSAIESMGMLVDLSTSTEDAQRKLGRRGVYDVVLSDMGRHDDPRAGYTLLDWMRRRNDDTPFIIYSSSNSTDHFNEAVAHGAVGSTSRPQDLIDMILRSLKGAHPRLRWSLRS